MHAMQLVHAQHRCLAGFHHLLPAPAHPIPPHATPNLTGVLCTAWLVHSRPTTSATTSSTTSEAAPPPRPNLRIRRLWLVNQHNCSVHTSRAVALGPKAGVVHAWGPRETEPEPGDRSQGHHSDPHAGGGGREQRGGVCGVPALLRGAAVPHPQAGPVLGAVHGECCWHRLLLARDFFA